MCVCEKSNEDDGSGCKLQEPSKSNILRFDIEYIIATQDGNWDMAKTASGIGACLEDR